MVVVIQMLNHTKKTIIGVKCLIISMQILK